MVPWKESCVFELRFTSKLDSLHDKAEEQNYWNIEKQRKPSCLF